MEEVFTAKLFYPMLFTTITIVLVVLIVAIKSTFTKFKDSDLFNNIFNRHVDEHIDTTDKFSKAHSEVVDGIPKQYQQELHSIEVTVREEQTKLNKLVQEVSDINEKLDILLEWKFETERKKK